LRASAAGKRAAPILPDHKVLAGKTPYQSTKPASRRAWSRLAGLRPAVIKNHGRSGMIRPKNKHPAIKKMPPIGVRIGGGSARYLARFHWLRFFRLFFVAAQ
jgi:hypothetical protein